MFSLYLSLPPTRSPELVFFNRPALLPSGPWNLSSHPSPTPNYQAPRRKVCLWGALGKAVARKWYHRGTGGQAGQGRAESPASTSIL